MSSRSINFRRGPFRDWSIHVMGDTDTGEVTRTLVTLMSPAQADGKPLSGILSFSPGVPGFTEMAAALDCGAGIDALETALEWIVEATRAALDERGDLDDGQRGHWGAVVDAADASRAAWATQYPDGVVPAFELLGTLVYADGRLAAVGGRA